MLTVDHFARIRQLHRDGLTIRQIAEQLDHSPKTHPQGAGNTRSRCPYTLSQPRPAPVFGPFRAIVDAILAADETAPRKQRHTASQIYRRLVAEHGYTGGYDQVRRYLQQRRLRPPRDVHPAGPSARAVAPRPTSATSTSTSPTAGVRCRC